MYFIQLLQSLSTEPGVSPLCRCRELVLMALAAACLHLFAQSNWTGPSVQIHDSDLLPPAVLSSQVYHLIILSRGLIYQLCAYTEHYHPKCGIYQLACKYKNVCKYKHSSDQERAQDLVVEKQKHHRCHSMHHTISTFTQRVFWVSLITKHNF